MNIDAAKVLLTGAGGGIGSLVAERLAAAGAELLLTDVRSDALERTAAACRSPTKRVATMTANVTRAEDRAALVHRAGSAAINVLINVAGVNPFGLYAEQSDAEIRTTIEINTIAPMLLCRAMLPILAARACGHIVNVGSTFGSIGFPGFCAYSASKFAIHGFTEALRRELGDTSIAVHYLAPRATRTALSTDRIKAMNAALGVGMDAPAYVADSVVQILRENRREIFLGWPEKIFARLNGLVPGLVDRSIAKQLTEILRHAAGECAPLSDDGLPAGRH